MKIWRNCTWLFVHMNYIDNSVPVVSDRYQPMRFADVGRIHKPHGQVCPCSFRTLGAFINCMDNSVPTVPECYQPAHFENTGVSSLISACVGSSLPAVVGSIHKLRGQIHPRSSRTLPTHAFWKYQSIFINLSLRWARSTCCCWEHS